MRIVKYTSILSTLFFIAVIGFVSKSFALTIPLEGISSESLPVSNQYEAQIFESDEEQFIPEDNEYLNSFEIYYASREFFSKDKHVILSGAKVHIKVSRKNQTMKVYVGGKRKYSWKTTTGSSARFGKGATTPSGTYTPYAMTKSHLHSSGRYRLPYSIKMYKGYFIHGTKANHMLGKKLSRTVGSHGCMRLSMKNARTLYSLVSRYGRKNTKITVY